MKTIKVLIFSFFTICVSLCADDVSGRSLFLGNVGNGVSNGLIQEAGMMHQPEARGYVHGSIGFFVGSNFNREEVGNYLFFNGTNTMKFGPAKTANNDTDVFSLNFLFDNAFTGTATINPSVKTVGFDIRMFGFLTDKVWFQLNIPVVHTEWDMNLETTDGTVAATFPANTFSNGGGEAITYKTIAEAWKGDAIPTASAYTEKWKYGKVDGPRKKTTIGNVKLCAGYDFVSRDKCQFEIGILGLINGSDPSTAEYLFEPTVGTGRRHGVGARIDARFKLKEKDDYVIATETGEKDFFGRVKEHEVEHNGSIITGHLRADFLHVQSKSMKRSYDFTANGKGSRYLLLRRHVTFQTLAAVDGVLNAINITSLKADIGIDFLYDVNAMLRWRSGSYHIDCGYGLWGHTKENHNGWQESMNSGPFTFYADGNANYFNAPNANNRALYPSIKINGDQGVAGNAMAAAADLERAKITRDLLDIDSGLQPATMTHSVYLSGLYRNYDHEKEPFASLGVKIELSGNGNRALDQWSLFGSSGIAF